VKPPEIGSIGWHDLTVPEAAMVRDFYSKVVGWKHEAVDMGGYSDFNMMMPATATPAAGICHARGVNQGLPPCWLIYITVEDINTSTNRCTEFGGKVIVGPKGLGDQGRYCVIQDPAGAFVALFEPARLKKPKS